MAMSKYWRKTMTADYSRPFKNWHSVISAPIDGSLFMGRIAKTNRARAFRYDEVGVQFVDAEGVPATLCQWISFAEYAQIQHCVWRTK